MRAIDETLVGEGVMREKKSIMQNPGRRRGKNHLLESGTEVGPLKDGRRKPGQRVEARKPSRGGVSDSVAMRFWPVERESRSWGGGRQGVRSTM